MRKLRGTEIRLQWRQGFWLVYFIVSSIYVLVLLLLLVWSLPLVLALFAGWRHARWLALIAPLPALVAAATLPLDTRVTLPWLLLGTELGVDPSGRVFLLFSALLWLAASLYAAGSPASERQTPRWRIFFLAVSEMFGMDGGREWGVGHYLFRPHGAAGRG